MADRYWVGGTGNWNDTARWSTSSGGASGASVPTSADNVFFDNNSAAGTFTVTVNVTPSDCANFDASGITNAARKMTLAGSATLQCYGYWTNPTSTFFASTYSGFCNFATSTVNVLITTNGVNPGWILNLGTTGSGSYLLAGALTCNAIVGINGTLDTGGYAVTCNSLQYTGGTGQNVTYTLNSSTITLNLNAGVSFVGTGTLTINAGTSTIVLAANSAGFNGAGKTFYNVTFTSPTIIGTNTITGSNTFTNLTFTAPTVTGIKYVSILANQTVTGTLQVGTASSVSAIQRIFLYSDTIGTQRTITMSGASSAITAVYDVDFRDIVIAQASGSTAAFPSDSSRTYRYGNCLNNSGITFSSGVSRYWNLAGTQNWSATGWATTNTGSPALANFPLAQDTATFTEAGSAGTVTINAAWNIGAIQMADGVSNRSTAMTLASGTTTPSIYGNITFFSSLTLSGTGAWTLAGKGTTQVITSAGITFTQTLTINSVGGTVAIAANTTTSTIILINGTIDLTNSGAGNYTLSINIFSSTNTTTRAITFGTGQITITGTNANVWNMANMTGFTYTGTSNVQFTGAGTGGQTRTINQGFTAGSSASNALNLTISAGADTISFNSFVVANNLTLTSGFTGICPVYGILYGNLTLSSGMTSPSSSGSLSFSAASGTQTITTNGKTFDGPIIQNNSGATLQLQDNLTMGSTRTFTLTSGTLDLNAQTATINTFSSTGSGTRAINVNSGTLSISGTTTSAFTASGSNLTTSGAGTITMTAATAKTFAGGGFAYTATLNQGGAGALTISGSNTFAGLSDTTQPATITVTAGTTQTFTGAVTIAGTAGNLITLNSSTPGTRYTFTFPTSTTTSSLSYTSITDCIGYQNAYWQAYQTNGNVNGGNNLGWIFVPMVYTAGASQFST